MLYAEFPLTDLGYVDGEGNPLASIEGRDNQDAPFRHLGYAGYPDVPDPVCFDAPDKSKTLCILGVGAALPAGAVPVQAANVPALLVAEYAWPVGTTLVDGLPVRPQE